MPKPAKPVKDKVTGKTYRSEYQAGKDLYHLVGGDPKDRFVWFRIRRAFPERFEIDGEVQTPAVTAQEKVAGPAKRVSLALAKAHLSELVAGVDYRGEQVVIERRGRPVAALVSIDDLDRLERDLPARPRGALVLVGAWRDVPEKDLDAVIEDIYAQRDKDMGRPVELEP